MPMKTTGVVRKIDELGRIVIPKEVRTVLGIGVKDAVEIFVDQDRVVLRKYVPGCIFCGETKQVSYYKHKRVCQKCRESLCGDVRLEHNAS